MHSGIKFRMKIARKGANSMRKWQFIILGWDRPGFSGRLSPDSCPTLNRARACPGIPEKAFRSNEYFTKNLTDDEKKATKITEVSFFKIEDIKTASKKEYGYILTLDTNGVLWESYIQSQGFMNSRWYLVDLWSRFGTLHLSSDCRIESLDRSEDPWK